MRNIEGFAVPVEDLLTIGCEAGSPHPGILVEVETHLLHVPQEAPQEEEVTVEGVLLVHLHPLRW